MDPWAVSCAGCGAPAAISLAHPDEVRCTHCGEARPPGPEVVERLAAGRAALEAVQTSARQLDRHRRRALHRADNAVVLFTVGLVLLLLAAPVYLCGGGYGLLVGDGESMLFGCTCTNMLLSLLVLVPLAWRRMVARRRQLVRSCAAEPPLTPGAAARCRLCGGDLPDAAGAEAVVRCTYCDADNLVAADAIAAEADAVRQGHGDLVEAIRSKSELIDERVGVGMLLAVVGTMWTVHAVLLLPTMAVVYVTLGLVHGFPASP